MTRIQDHPPLQPGPGQKVEYHSRHYYDGWDGVPEEYKGNGWVLINHTTTPGANFVDYNFQRLTESPMTEPTTAGDPPASEPLRDPAVAPMTEPGTRVELAELRAEMRAIKRQDTAIEPISHAVPVLLIDAMRQRQQFLEDVVANFFHKGIHYGEPFPGSRDMMLYKMGAEWIASAFGVRPEYDPLNEVIERGVTPFVQYRYRCNLRSIKSGQIVGSAVGQCSSEEDKYKYQQAKYKCPSCGKDTIIKDSFAKDDAKEGWVCLRKSGGCGAKYAKNAIEITTQPKPGRVLNLEVVGSAHTIDAMAQKRAFVLAIREAFGLSSIFRYFEGLDDPKSNGEPVTINGTAKPKARTATPGEINQLIDFAISLDPDRLGKVKRTLIGESVLNALGMKDWAEPFNYNTVEAELAIRAKVTLPEAPSAPGESMPAAKCDNCGIDDADPTGPFPALCKTCANKRADQSAAVPKS